MDFILPIHHVRCLRSAPLVIALIFGPLSMVCNDRTTEDFENLLNVSGVVRNETVSIKLTVDRTYNMDEPEGPALDSATVMIFNSDFSDTFVSEQHGMYHLVYDMQVIAGATYNLMVVAEGYDTVFGQTTVPGDYQILNPMAGDTVTINDTLIYAVGNGIKDYQIWCHYGPWEEGLYYYFPNFFNDSMIKIPLAVFSEFIDMLDTNGVCTFEIAGYDSNYYNYHYFYDSSEPPRCGVRGGIGLFGSAWVRSVQVYLKLD